MKIICMILVASLLIVSFSGCNRNAPEPTVTPLPPTAPTVETSPSQTTEPTETTAPTENIAPASPEMINGSFEIRLSDWDTDEDGTFLTYAGGEVEVPLRITATGDIRQKKIGILLFVDGQPQPYRTEASQEYAYLHTFTLPKPSANEIRIWFIPITGATGDAPEVYIKPLLDPHRTLATNSWPSLGTTPAIMFRLKYQTTPLSAAFPEKQLRLTQTAIRYADTTPQEIGTWTEEELEDKTEQYLYINGQKGDHDAAIYEVTQTSDITLRFESWGSPHVHYSVVFFVDHQPVFSADALPIYIEIQTGQKTVVEATLSMADFTGESLVYAVLVPRNYTKIKNHCFLDCTKVFFLTEQIDPDSTTL